MDDDDDSCFLDLIGDPQALNYFLHGPSGKTNTDSKSSNKGASIQLGEGSSDALQLSTSLQFLEDDLESSSLPDLSEDQPFDILQKSLQEANITEQNLAEEAYLDASIGSNQQFTQSQLHPSSSTPFTQASNVCNYSGQTLHPIGLTHVPVVQHPVGASFASNTVGVQHGFMQQVGISVPSQHLSSSSQISGSGQIQLIGSFNNPPSMMTINNLDGSQIILKGNGQQASANMSGGLLVHRQTPNGNPMFGNSNSSPAGQTVTVPFGNAKFQTSLPVHNIIIQRGLAPNANKIPINIQPKPIQMGQQAAYSVNNLGVQQHHIPQGIPFTSAHSPQSSVVGPQMNTNIASQQNARKSVTPQTVGNTGGNIVIHSPMGQPHMHQNQFLIPAGLSVNSNSVQHVQAINGQILQTQPTHLVPSQVSADHMMLNRNSTSLVRANQPYAGQMLSNQNAAVQLVSGPAFPGPGNHVIVNHGTSQIVGGQMPLQQASPTLLHLSPNQSGISQGRPNFTTLSTGQPSVPNMPVPNRFTVVSSGTVHHNLGPPLQTVASESNFIGDQLVQQNRTQVSVSVSHRLPVLSSKSAYSHVPVAVTQQPHSCCQTPKKAVNQPSPVSTLKTQDSLRQPQLTCLLNNTCLPGQASGGKLLQQTLGTAQLQQEKIVGSPPLQQTVQMDGQTVGQKRPAAEQLTKGTFMLQQIQHDQAQAVAPDKTKFRSLNDVVQRLLSYHVCQGSLPTDEDLKKVDNDFESVATQLLKRTQAMLNRYRWLLIEDATRINPSAEMVMIDRMFNQEERTSLTRDKRFALMDPESYQADFCCSSKFLEKPADEAELSDSNHVSKKNSISPSQATRLQDPTKSIFSDSTNNVMPNNTVTPHMVKTGTAKIDSLLKNVKVQQASCSGSPCTNATAKQSDLECPSESAVLSRRLKKEENNGKDDKATDDIIKLNSDISCNNSLQEKALRNSPKNEVLPAGIVKCANELQEATLKSLETTVNSILELKKRGGSSETETTDSSAARSEYPRFSCISQDNCLEKCGSDQNEGAVETDSILEAAVNSILEC
uniref:BRD4-interacting chromatin-remodeling complex-associated protein-like isoform X2 n=1 Tax=Geotrypetes seraphini TaxID=260995 RepID=A0A6P8Q2A3_GEOSA|nr:BRD4-interacting chromatin-remodeling complex-associated protein-like isoform X2 [Geotrypetes seraphini]